MHEITERPAITVTWRTAPGQQLVPLTPATPQTAYRPYWQSEACPAWCDATHDDSDWPDDRVHYGVQGTVPLTLHRPVRGYDGWEAPDLQVAIRQHYREVEPAIELFPDDGRQVLLTLAEAERVSLEILRQVTAARLGGVR